MSHSPTWTESIRTSIAAAPKAKPAAATKAEREASDQGDRQLNACCTPNRTSNRRCRKIAARRAATVLRRRRRSPRSSAKAERSRASCPGFHFRPQQLGDGARQSRQTIAARGQLVAEAGTGTGKTFAYLVPALLYGGKVIVSTGTKTLQDQLFERDLPLVRDALRVPVTIALLEGPRQLRLPLPPRARVARRTGCRRAMTRAICRRSSRSRARRSAATAPNSPTCPEHASIWPLVTSTRDNCLGQNCAYHGDCFVLKARKDALDADVVVVNHHLFFADVMLRDEGVVRAAAQLQYGDPRRGAPAAGHRDALLRRAGRRRAARRAGARRRGRRADRRARRAGASRTRPRNSFPRSTGCAWPPETSPASSRATSRWRRAGFAEALDGLAAALDRLATELGPLRRTRRGARHRSRGAPRKPRARLRDGAMAKRRFRTAPTTQGDWIRWIDVTPYGFQLQASPLSVAPLFKRQVESTARAWIFTSATLAVGRDFTLYTQQLGSTKPPPGAWDSPFDYSAQALLYVPQGLPAPNSLEHTDAVVDAALPLLRASGGRAFLLFTTLRALQHARERLAAAFAREGLDYPLLVQGDGSQVGAAGALSASWATPCLLGSASFWEGVDVPGAALSLVVIDKLPFAPPDDPLLCRAPRPPEARRRQSVHGVAVAAGRDRARSRARGG